MADCCRQAILQHNPHHVVGRWPTFEAGLCQEDFLSLLHQIERRYPLEKAEQMLDALGIVPSQQRQKYATVEQYLAALLGVTPERLEGF